MSSRAVRPTASFKGPAELVLAASIARRFYVDGRTKIEIADELRISRFKVARLLEAARDQGLVQIHIRRTGLIDLDRSSRLQDRFGLDHAIVVDTSESDHASLRSDLGHAAADLLTEIINVHDVLGLAWARSVQAMVNALQQLPPVPVVQLTGALSSARETSSSIEGDSSVDIVREVARRSGGPAYLFFAPLVVPDAMTARAMRRQPDVARAFERMPSVSVAVVGIGHWAAGQSTIYDAATDGEHAKLAQEGVCAEVAGAFMNAEGELLTTSLNERMIAIDGHQMRDVSQLIAIPYGTSKAPAVLAALRSGLVSSLVTHVSLADALLNDPRQPR